MPLYGLGNAVGSVGAEGDFGSVDGFLAPPVCTVQPVVTGSAALGSTLTTTDGTFVGTGLGAASRQWYRGTNTPISGQTASTYATASADYGLGVFCVVSRSNTAGSASGTSNAITVTATAPVNTVAGVLSGDSAAGSTLTCSSGTWTGSPTITFVYQFYLNGVADGSAGANTRVNQVGDIGKTVTCKPIGTNIVSTVTGTASNGIIVTAAIAQNVWDSSVNPAHITYSVGDTVAVTASDYIGVSLAGKTSGVWDVIVALSNDGTNNFVLGCIRSDVATIGGYPGVAGTNGVGIYSGGVIFKGSAGTASPLVTPVNNQSVRMHIDMDNGTIEFFVGLAPCQAAPIALTGWSAGQVYKYALGAGSGSGQTFTITQGWTAA